MIGKHATEIQCTICSTCIDIHAFIICIQCTYHMYMHIAYMLLLMHVTYYIKQRKCCRT